MDVEGSKVSNFQSGGDNDQLEQEEMLMMDLRRGPWTVDEDLTLMNYITKHGEGRWNSLARCAGLKRTGKSCRLRWLNYLRPDVRRGNITLEEQLLILELHSRWGNRWSKIAQHMPGRTDNEIKNYWRTRVQKHAKQLKCDVNSKQFKDTMRYLWMPRLVERIQAASGAATSHPTAVIDSSTATSSAYQINHNNFYDNISPGQVVAPPATGGYMSENSSTAASSESFGTQVSPASDLTDYYPVSNNNNNNQDYYQADNNNCYYPGTYPETLTSPYGYFNPGSDIQSMEAATNPWFDGSDTSDYMWNAEDVWFLQQQFNNIQ